MALLKKFSQGSIEFEDQRIESSSVSGINSSGDFVTLDQQLSCEFDSGAHAYQYIIWDYNHNEAMSSGWFYTYQYDPYQDISSEIVPYPGNCGARYVSWRVLKGNIFLFL